MDDFEDMLKKALEEEQRSGDMDGDDISGSINGILGIIGTGELLKLGNAAKAKMDEVLKNLTKELQECEKMSMPKFHAYATVKVQRAAEEIKILNAIISTSAICGVHSLTGKNDNTSEILDTILKLNMMR